MKLNRIEITCFVENKASKQVIEKVDGILKEKLRKKTYSNGKFHDLYLFSILRKDFLNKRKL